MTWHDLTFTYRLARSANCEGKRINERKIMRYWLMLIHFQHWMLIIIKGVIIKTFCNNVPLLGRVVRGCVQKRVNIPLLRKAGSSFAHKSGSMFRGASVVYFFLFANRPIRFLLTFLNLICIRECRVFALGFFLRGLRFSLEFFMRV